MFNSVLQKDSCVLLLFVVTMTQYAAQGPCNGALTVWFVFLAVNFDFP